MPLSHAKLWKAVDALARREGLSPSGLARRAGLDATSFNPSKRFGAGDPPRPRWPSTESMTLILQATGVSLAEFAGLADDAPPTSTTVPLLGLARASGETAPLLFTSLGNQFVSTNINEPIAAIPQLIYQNTIQVQTPASLQLAWGAALVLVAIILVLNLAAALISRRARPAEG